MTARMNVSERQALRGVVKQRMKVLRSDVTARKAELEAEIADTVQRKYAQRDKLVADMNQVVAGIIDQANKDIRAAVEKASADHGVTIILPGRLPDIPVSVDNSDRYRLTRQLQTEVQAQVAAALVDIDRREADLIEELTIDGLTTEAAKNFLSRIPTVGQLVPAARAKAIAG